MSVCNIYEFIPCEPSKSSKLPELSKGDLAWRFLQNHGPVDAARDVKMCQDKKARGLKGFFVRAKTQEDARAMIAQTGRTATDIESFYIL